MNIQKKFILLCTIMLLTTMATVSYAQVFWSEDFAGGIPATWTNQDIGAGGLNWGQVPMDQTEVPAGNVPFASTTVANGFAQAAAPGTNTGSHTAQLTTGVIDCSAYGQVTLSFNAQYAYFATANGAKVGVSTDNSTFTYYDIFPNEAANAFNPPNELIELDISAQAANQSTVYVQFQYQGIGFTGASGDYYLKIDDIELSNPVVVGGPPNDNVCDAIDITGGASGFVMSNDGATVEPGEEAIAPPFSDGCAPGGWCDFSGADGGAGIDNSIWFKFDAPASGSIMLSACLSDFDNQLAVYEVGDCSDFGTFTMIWATDDQVDCGFLPDATPGLASEMTLDCLNPGQTYYAIVDGWQNAAGDASIVGAIDLVLSDIAATGTSVVIDSVGVVAPTCMGGSDGSATAFVTMGPPPFSYLWDNGTTSASVTGLAAGTYSVSVTDFCNNVETSSIVISDGPPPATIVLATIESDVVNPTDCGSGTINGNAAGSDGQISVGVESGTAPFSFTWSTGDSTSFVGGLPAGTYTVTVGDACDNPVAVETYVLETEASVSANPAGEDVMGDCSGSGLQIGSANSGYGSISEATYSTDQEVTGNVACLAGGVFYASNSYWRAFDLDADFGLSGNVKIEGVDFVLTATAGPAFNGLQPTSFRLYTSSSLDLSTATLSMIDEVNTMIPDMATSYYRAPLNAVVAASDIIVVEIFHPGPSEDEHQFSVGANMTVTSQPTYLSSGDCGIGSPTLITDIGFDQQTIMNVIYREESTNFTYAWDGPAGGLSSTTDAMPNASISGIYTVTVTDDCGSTVDAVEVDCTVGIVNPEDAAFIIAPNPSQGLFYLENTDIAKNISLEVYDVQGRLMLSESFNNALHTLNLSNYAKGVYIMKLDDGLNIETHKLVIY